MDSSSLSATSVGRPRTKTTYVERVSKLMIVITYSSCIRSFRTFIIFIMIILFYKTSLRSHDILTSREKCMVLEGRAM